MRIMPARPTLPRVRPQALVAPGGGRRVNRDQLARLDDIWLDRKAGRITLDQACREIMNTAAITHVGAAAIVLSPAPPSEFYHPVSIR
jgi:hypothetical protein